ncbi:MAG: hypothetical protein MJZ99_11575, partial [Bacteroidales bacterium]|nr:hypothetical protein [Bacteroidales bacterium]
HFPFFCGKCVKLFPYKTKQFGEPNFGIPPTMLPQFRLRNYFFAFFAVDWLLATFNYSFWVKRELPQIKSTKI